MVRCAKEGCGRSSASFLCANIVWLNKRMSSLRAITRRWLQVLGLAVLGVVIITAGMLAINAARNGEFPFFGDAQRAGLEQFTLYAPPGSQPRLTQSSIPAIEFTATPQVTVRESQVLKGQEANVAPPYNCNIALLNKVMRGSAAERSLHDFDHASDSIPNCSKVGFTKDKKPVYQQHGSSDSTEVYYYTRIDRTHIVLVVPLAYVADPAQDPIAEVIGVADSLQPFDSAKVQDAR